MVFSGRRNIFVALAPVFARRLEQGKGGVYVFRLCAFSVYPLIVSLNQFLGFRHEIDHLGVGCYLWQTSLLGTVTWFLWAIFLRPVIFAGSGLLAVLAFFGPPIVSEQQNRQHSLDAARVAIGYADKQC